MLYGCKCGFLTYKRHEYQLHRKMCNCKFRIFLRTTIRIGRKEGKEFIEYLIKNGYKWQEIDQ